MGDKMNLKFNNGKFRIMQIADTQDTNKTAPATVEFIRYALKTVKPDLVVFTGDQIKGYGVNLAVGDRKKNVACAINNLLKPLDEAGGPFTFVFGNHDDTSFSISKQEQFEVYKSHANCLAFNADDSIDGYCNHNLEILGEDGKTKLNVYLIDSLSMSAGGSCAHVSENQLDWYRKTRDSLKERYGDYVPSIVFQHIPVPEIYELLKEVPRGTKGSAKGYRKYNGKYFALNPETTVIDDRSFIGETPSVPDINGGEFDALHEKGDVFGAFFGHDHNNSFVGEYKGIKMGYCQGCGFNIYGPAKNRGVRIYDFNEENPADFETSTLTVADIENFDVGNRLKYAAYTYAPSSVDSVKPYIKGGAVVAAAAAVGGILIRFLIK